MGHSPWGHKESDMTERLTTTTKRTSPLIASLATPSTGPGVPTYCVHVVGRQKGVTALVSTLSGSISPYLPTSRCGPESTHLTPEHICLPKHLLLHLLLTSLSKTVIFFQKFSFSSITQMYHTTKVSQEYIF